MPQPQDLANLLTTETDRVEWKGSTNNREGILRAVGALANDLGGSGQPGFVVIGVDKAGTVIGVDQAGSLDDQQRDLADRVRSGKIQPIPSTSIQMVLHGSHALLVVEVTPYPVPPIVEVDGMAWVRVGTTTRRASQADLQRLSERRPERSLPFDTRPLAGAGLDDLRADVLQRLWQAARDADGDPSSFPELQPWLTQRQLGRPVAGTWTPNAAAVLLFGKSPQDHMPGARIDLVRYAGGDVDAPVASRKLATGTLADQLEIAWAWVSLHVATVPAEPEGIREAFVPTYPVEALKELVRNVVQHRLYEGTNAPSRIEWFDDRIELSNPGGPFGRASEGEFGTHSDYRNPLVTAGLVASGHVQQLGRGIRRARQQLHANGNPPMAVQTDGFTRVIVHRRP